MRYVWHPATDRFIRAADCVVVDLPDDRSEWPSQDIESAAYMVGTHKIEPGERLPDGQLDALRGY